MERPTSHPLTPGRLVAAGIVAVVVLTVWWQFNRPTITPSLVTIEQDTPSAYEVPLSTPLLINDNRDLARVRELLHQREGDLLAEIDLRHSFALVATTEVCAPYLRRSDLVITGDRWWVGRRPATDDITDLYNLCEEQLIDFHIFEVDRVHFDLFDEVPVARRRPELGADLQSS